MNLIPKNEPDYAVFYKKDMSYIIKRHPEGKHLCGYIALKKDHPLYAEDHFYSYDIHGGITYDKIANYTCFYGMFTDQRVIGFDCNHLLDIAPGDSSNEFKRNLIGIEYDTSASYKDINFVLSELDGLAKQIRDKVKVKENEK